MWAPLPSSESSQVEAGSSSRSGTSQQQQPWELVRNAHSWACCEPWGQNLWEAGPATWVLTSRPGACQEHSIVRSPGLALLSHLARFSSQVPPHSVKRPESLELGTGHPWFESPPVIPGLGPLLETPSRHWLAL